MARKEYAEVTIERAAPGETIGGPLVRIAIKINDGYKEPIGNPKSNATPYDAPEINAYGP